MSRQPSAGRRSRSPEAGRFRVELLTGLSAGERGGDGRFPEGSVNGRVEARLHAFAEAARAAHKPDENANAKDGT